MRKLLTVLAASAALAGLISTGQACDFHNMSTSASAGPAQEVVAMSTAQTPAPPVTVTCAPDAKDCAPAKK